MSGADEFLGKVALITGGGRGIGLATAREFAMRGASIVLVDRAFGAEATALITDVASRGRLAEAASIDLAQPDVAAQALQALIAGLPPIDVLVNNAGWIQVRPFLEITVAEWQQHLAVNLTGMFVCTQTVLPAMLERRDGRVIMVSSELALTGMAHYAAYCAAKGGVIGLTKALAREVAGAGIRVNCVAPGPTVTAMLTESTGEYTEETRRALPAQRFGTPEDIARTIAFLAGAGGDFFVGQVLSPNGGAVI